MKNRHYFPKNVTSDAFFPLLIEGWVKTNPNTLMLSLNNKESVEEYTEDIALHIE